VTELRRMLASGAADPLAEALDGLSADEHLLLAVDQFEELFTACEDDGQRSRFVGILCRAAADPQRRAIVAVALRADFYGRISAYPALAELLSANHVLVGPMHPSELRRAVELPAGRAGLRVEPELADALVDDVENEPGALPLLSTALLELWQKREGGVLTLAAYRESGGVHGAVARLAEETYARVPDERQALVRALLLRLVGDGEGEATVRRRASLAELDLERNEDAAQVLAALADSRLVTVSEDTVEVAHEALLREWPRLREWIEEDGQGRQLRRHITDASQEWDATGRDRTELYRGARLAAALDWSADHAFELNELEREFVTASREASERETKGIRRTNRRLRGLLAGVAVLLAAAVAGGIFAVIQRGEAREAETAQLAQRLGVQALVEEDFDRAALLARQAVATDDTLQTRNSLLATLLRAPTILAIMHGEGDFLRGAAISPDGETLVVADSDQGLSFFDTARGERIGQPLRLPPWIWSVAYSPDGQTVAIAASWGIRIFDAETREVLAERIGAWRVAFTNDAAQLVIVDDLGGGARMRFLDAATLEPSMTINGEGFLEVTAIKLGDFDYVAQFPEPPHFALAPDGRSVVTASVNGVLAWWDLESGEKTRTIEIATGHHALALSADGSTAAVGVDGGLQLVDLHTGEVRDAVDLLGVAPSWLAFSPDSSLIVSTGIDGAVTLWDARTGRVRATLGSHAGSAQQPVFSPDGRTLYTVGHDGAAIAWDISGELGLGRAFQFTEDDPAEDASRPGRFSPDGLLIAVGLEDEGIQLRDATTLAALDPPLLETGGEVSELAFAPDGRTLAAATANGMVTLWDVSTGSPRAGPFTTESEWIDGIAISPDGTTLATAGETGVRLWDALTGVHLADLGGDGAWAGDVAFSPDGSTLAFVHGDGGNAELWSVVRRSRIAMLDRKGRPGEHLGYAVAFSPDGQTLVTAGLDPLVHFWDVETGTLARQLEAGGGGVQQLEFSPDGTILAVARWEPVAVLLDVTSGAQFGRRLTAGADKAMIDLSADGRALLLTHGSGEGAIWDLDPESWKRRACSIANRILTPEEWARFLPGRPYEPACA
jgi:WD40 repeat protein